MWRSVEKACEWKHPQAPTVRLLTPVVLTFLRDTEAGRAVALTSLEEEWEGLEEVDLWPTEAEGQDEEGEKGGPGPP